MCLYVYIGGERLALRVRTLVGRSLSDHLGICEHTRYSYIDIDIDIYLYIHIRYTLSIYMYVCIYRWREVRASALVGRGLDHNLGACTHIRYIDKHNMHTYIYLHIHIRYIYRYTCIYVYIDGERLALRFCTLVGRCFGDDLGICKQIRYCYINVYIYLSI